MSAATDFNLLRIIMLVFMSKDRKIEIFVVKIWKFETLKNKEPVSVNQNNVEYFEIQARKFVQVAASTVDEKWFEDVMLLVKLMAKKTVNCLINKQNIKVRQ